MHNKRLLLVDGHNLLFQMYFGMPTRIVNKNNKQIQGVIGFIGALLKIIKVLQPTNVLVVFDSETKNERVVLDENYKANRIDYSNVCDEDNPFSQLNDIYQCLDFLKIKHFEALNEECDDVISHYVYKYKHEYEIYISSYDSDFFQLIDKNVFVYRYKGKQSYICDSDYLLKTINVLPEKYVFYKTLKGDDADNIKGVKGIGKITAAKIVNAFNNLDELYINIEKIKNAKMKESLFLAKERVYLNYQLIKLNINDDVKLDIDELAYEDNFQLKTMEVLKNVGII